MDIQAYNEGAPNTGHLKHPMSYAPLACEICLSEDGAVGGNGITDGTGAPDPNPKHLVTWCV